MHAPTSTGFSLKLGAAQLAGRKNWPERYGPLPEATPLGPIELALRLRDASDAIDRYPTIEEVADDTRGVLAAVRSLKTKKTARADLAKVLARYNAVIVRDDTEVHVLFAVGPVGHLCVLRPDV